MSNSENKAVEEIDVRDLIIKGVDENISALTSSLLLLAVLSGGWVYKSWLVPKAKKISTSFKNSAKTDRDIHGVLSVLLDKHNASRALLYQTHNGTVYASGSHQWKVSITHEVVNQGVTSVKHLSQSELSVEFLSKYSNLIEEGVEFFESEKNGTKIKDTKIRYCMLNSGIDRLGIWTLTDSDNQIIGFLSLHWDEASKISPDVSREMDKICALLSIKNCNPFSTIIDHIFK